MLYAIIGFLIAMALVYGFTWMNKTSTIQKDMAEVIILAVIGIGFSYVLPIVLNWVFDLFKSGDSISPWVLVILGAAAGFLSKVFVLPLFIKKTQK